MLWFLADDMGGAMPSKQKDPRKHSERLCARSMELRDRCLREIERAKTAREQSQKMRKIIGQPREQRAS